MTSTVEGTARTAAQLHEAARDVAVVAERRGRLAQKPETRSGGPAPMAPADRIASDVRVPPDPEARDRRWPGWWPLRTHLELAAQVTAPGSARAHVRAVLREWQAGDETIEVAALVATELLTNAIEATRAHRRDDPVRLWVLGDTRSVLVLVWDATVPVPVLGSPAPDAENGRGLALVAGLSERLGCYRPAERPFGKVVWVLIGAGHAHAGARPAPARSRLWMRP